MTTKIETPSCEDQASSAHVIVRVADAAWIGDCAEIEILCRRAAIAALAARPADGRPLGEVVILLTDDATVRDLNARFRGLDRPTNVLSFPARDGVERHADASADMPDPLGDVALAHATVAGEARAQGKAFAAHATHLVVHGVLHLLGFDHISNRMAERMEALETDILHGLGIANPYVSPDTCAPTTRTDHERTSV